MPSSAPESFGSTLAGGFDHNLKPPGGGFGKGDVSFVVDTTAPAISLIVSFPRTINTTPTNVFFSQDEAGTANVYLDLPGDFATAFSDGEQSSG